MILLTETVLFYWDLIDSFCGQCSPVTGKHDFAGISEVVDWANKLNSSKPLHTLLSHRSTTSSRHARSVSSTGTVSRHLAQPPVLIMHIQSPVQAQTLKASFEQLQQVPAQVPIPSPQ